MNLTYLLITNYKFDPLSNFYFKQNFLYSLALPILVIITGVISVKLKKRASLFLIQRSKFFCLPKYIHAFSQIVILSSCDLNIYVDQLSIDAR